MTKEESLQSQQTLRVINMYMMDMYEQGKLKREDTRKLPDKYQTPDWIWDNNNEKDMTQKNKNHD